MTATNHRGWRSITFCEDGCLFRLDPQPDDPYLATNLGKCPECDGRGCDDPTDDDYPEDYDEYEDIDEDAVERAEANRIARIEWENYHPGEPCPDCELPFPRNAPDDERDQMAKPKRVDLTEDRLFPLGWGLIYSAVCAPGHWAAEQVAAEATRMNPPGTSLNEWVISEPKGRGDVFNGTNCIDCPDEPGRKHWLLNC